MKYLILDDGHGGKDPGAISKDGRGIKEKDVVRMVGNSLEKKLKKYDDKIKVYRPYKKDRYTHHTTRKTEFGRYSYNQYKKDKSISLMISLHMNSYNLTSAHGFEVYYYPGSKNGRKISNLIRNEFKNNKLMYADRGLKQAKFSVLSGGNSYIGALIELSFISNKRDLDLILNNIDKAAESILNSILKYWNIPKRKNNNPKPKPKPTPKPKPKNKTKVIYNKKNKDIKHIIKNNKIYMPLRELNDFLGIETNWNNKNKVININKKVVSKVNDNSFINFDNINSISNVPIISNEELFLFSGFVKNGTTFIAIREYLESLGFKVNWVNNQVILKEMI